jgi:hypothetical protein
MTATTRVAARATPDELVKLDRIVDLLRTKGFPLSSRSDAIRWAINEAAATAAKEIP